MKLLRPVAGIAVAAVLGAATATVIVHETAPGTTVVTRTVSVPTASNAADTSTSMTTINDIYRRSAKSVVEITSTTSGSSGAGGDSPFGTPSQGSGTAQGTGFVLDRDGHIVTNQHVVENATSISVKFTDGATATATLVGADPTSDIAVLKVNVDSSELPPLTLADSSAVQVGDSVIAIGDPYGLQNSVTTGIVSALDRTITSPNNRPIGGAIQTDAAINSGNSGGPLLDLNGQVIGVNSQIESQSGGNIGIGFAVPSNTVRSVVQQLISNGKATHPYLGVKLSDSSNPAGAKVGDVASGAPADQAGLKGGDVITAVDGTAVTSADQLIAVLVGHAPGDKVELTLSGGGTVTVTLGSR